MPVFRSLPGLIICVDVFLEQRDPHADPKTLVLRPGQACFQETSHPVGPHHAAADEAAEGGGPGAAAAHDRCAEGLFQSGGEGAVFEFV